MNQVLLVESAKMEIDDLLNDLARLKNPLKAKILAGFFKTGKGQYGEGDVFWGITVGDQRKIARKFTDLAFGQVEKLFKSKIHEQRLTALLILVQKFDKADEESKKKIVDFYLKNTTYINNWDLVDLSASHILGNYLLGKDISLLAKLAGSKDLWERRMAIIATLAFIKRNKLKEALKIATILIGDKHDLIQKAVGWMLRKVGKRNQKTLEIFLAKHYQIMPRVMLRYAIERFDDKRRRFYMEQ